MMLQEEDRPETEKHVSLLLTLKELKVSKGDEKMGLDEI